MLTEVCLARDIKTSSSTCVRQTYLLGKTIYALAAVWDQIGEWPLKREVERTIPQVHCADNTEIIKLPVGLMHIVANEAVNLTKLYNLR